MATVGTPSKLALSIAERYLRSIDGDDFGTADGHDINDLANVVDRMLRPLAKTIAPPLEHVAKFAAAFDAQPIGKTHDEFYGIHTGTEWEASLKLSELRKAVAAVNMLRDVGLLR